MFPGAEWVFHQCLSVIQSCNFAHGRQRFGLRWQPAEAKRSEDWSAAATPLSALPVASKSGVALRFPPQSKICGCGVSRAGLIRVEVPQRRRRDIFVEKHFANFKAPSGATSEYAAPDGALFFCG